VADIQTISVDESVDVVKPEDEPAAPDRNVEPAVARVASEAARRKPRREVGRGSEDDMAMGGSTVQMAGRFQPPVDASIA
jgi:hypothetical protein